MCGVSLVTALSRRASQVTRLVWTVRAIGLKNLPRAFPWANSWAKSGEPRGTGSAGSVLNQQPTFPLRPLQPPTEWVRVPSATPSTRLAASRGGPKLLQEQRLKRSIASGRLLPFHGSRAKTGEHLGEPMAVLKPFGVFFPDAHRPTVQERELRRGKTPRSPG